MGEMRLVGAIGVLESLRVWEGKGGLVMGGWGWCGEVGGVR